MKITLFLFSILLFSNFSFAQSSTERYMTNSPHILTNVERYKLDYELVDESILNSGNDILNSLELFRIEYVRQETEDVVFFDKKSGLEVLVYSNEKITSRKKSGNTIYQENN